MNRYLNKKFTVVFLLASLMFTSSAYADPLVDLQILNATGASGDIIVIAGEDIEVNFDVTLDTGGVLGKKDTLELVNVVDEMVASSKQRGNSTSGSVILTVPAGTIAAQFYVRYISIDLATEVSRVSHPDDPGSVPLVAIEESSLVEITARVAALEATDPVPGPAGADGADGLDGAPGADGADGLQGIQGLAGNDGADGADGLQGIQGLAGNDGADGADGLQGIQGLAGNDGADGATGPQGPAGPEGAQGNPGVLSDGTNTKAGTSALAINTGVFNSAFGDFALASNDSGGGNTGIGASALRENSNGNGNTAVGSQALTNNTFGDTNVAAGQAALFTNSTGNYNVGIGAFSLYSNTQFQQNVAVGHYALFSANNNFNTAVGFEALRNATGANNTAIGKRAGYQIVSGSNNIAIGSAGDISDNGVIRIGETGSQVKTFMAGISGVDLSTDLTATQVVVNADGQLGIGPGVAGPEGPQGPIGPTGLSGLSGADGLQGVQGVPGNDGADGAQGQAGADGATGPAGADGADGAQGPSGPSAFYASVATVALAGGDYISPIDAMANVSSGDTWCGTPSISNPCLIQIMPGVYDFGDVDQNTLNLLPFVTVKGSGVGVTVLKGSGGGTSINGVVTIPSNSGSNTMLDLTIEHSGGGNSAFGVSSSNSGNSTVNIQRVASNVQGGASQNIAFRIYRESYYRDVTANVNGVQGRGISGSTGVSEVRNSSINVTSTNFANGIVPGSNIASLLIVETDVSVDATLGNVIGVSLNSVNNAEVEIMSSRIEATSQSGNVLTRPVDLNGVSAVRIMSTTIEGFSAGGQSDGIKVGGSVGTVVTVQSSYVRNQGGNSSLAGFYTSNGVSATIDNSTIDSLGIPLRADGSTTQVLVGGSRIAGGAVSVSNGAVISCAGVFDEGNAFYANTCPP